MRAGRRRRETGVTVVGGIVHTVFRDGQWVNESEGIGQFGGVHTTKDRAAVKAELEPA